MGNLNPLRYRGYYYDDELGLYWLNTRFYDPNTGRFVNADSTNLVAATPGSASYDKNLYTYCDNNPITRLDVGGDFWSFIVKAVVKVTVAVAKKYVSDVVKNIADGKSGLDILKPSSSLGEYVAEGVTALISGSGRAASAVKSIVSEGIITTEKVITGKDVDIAQSVTNVVVGTAASELTDNVQGKLTIKTGNHPKISEPEVEEKFGDRNKTRKTVNQLVRTFTDIASLCVQP